MPKPKLTDKEKLKEIRKTLQGVWGTTSQDRERIAYAQLLARRK